MRLENSASGLVTMLILAIILPFCAPAPDTSQTDTLQSQMDVSGGAPIMALPSDIQECLGTSAAGILAGGLVANMEFDHGWQEYDPGPAPYSPTRRNAPNNRVTNLTPWLETFTVDRNISYTRTVEEGRTKRYPGGDLDIPIDGTFESVTPMSCDYKWWGGLPTRPTFYGNNGSRGHLCMALLCSDEYQNCSTSYSGNRDLLTTKENRWSFELKESPRIGYMKLYSRHAYTTKHRDDDITCDECLLDDTFFTYSISAGNSIKSVRTGGGGSCPMVYSGPSWYRHECDYERKTIHLDEITGRGEDVRITFKLTWIPGVVDNSAVLNVDDIEFFDVNGNSLGYGPGNVQVEASEEVIAPVMETVEENIDGEGSYWLNEFWNNRKIEPIIGYSDAVYDGGGNLVPIIPLSPDNSEFMFRSYVMTYSLDVYRYYDPYCNAGNGFTVRDRSVYEDHYNPPFRIDCYVETGGANLGSVSFGMDSTELSSIRTMSKKVLVDREEPQVSNVRIYPDIVSNSQRFVKAEEGVRICFDAYDDALIDRFFISRQPQVQDEQPPWIPIFESSPAQRVVATPEKVGVTWHICALTGPLKHNTIGLKVSARDFSHSEVFDAYRYRKGEAGHTERVITIGEKYFSRKEVSCDRYSVRAGEGVECLADFDKRFRNILQIYNEDGVRVSIKRNSRTITFTPRKGGNYYFESLYTPPGSDIVFGRTRKMAKIVVRADRPSRPVAVGTHDRVVIFPTHRCGGVDDSGGYKIYRNRNCTSWRGEDECGAAGSWVLITPNAIDKVDFETGFVDTNVEPGGVYGYAVKSINRFDAESELSLHDIAHPMEYYVNFIYDHLPEPDSPTGFTIKLTDVSGTTPDHRWDIGQTIWTGMEDWLTPFRDIPIALISQDADGILFQHQGSLYLEGAFAGRTDESGEVTGLIRPEEGAYGENRLMRLSILAGDLAAKELGDDQFSKVIAELSVDRPAAETPCFLEAPVGGYTFLGDGLKYTSCGPTVAFGVELPVLDNSPLFLKISS